MKNIFVFLFGKKKANTSISQIDSEEDVRVRLTEAVKECEIEIRKAYEKIDLYKKRAKDLIFDILNVPDTFWYDELNRYEDIKSIEANCLINEMIITKTDVLIEAYRTKIKLCETKVSYFKRLEGELQEQLTKLDKLKETVEKQNFEEQQESVLKRHQNFIDEESKDAEGQKMSAVDTGEQLSETIRKIEEDLRIKQKVKAYMENLEAELSKPDEKTDSLALKEMLEDLKKII